MRFYSDDPERDFAQWDMEMERRRERLPECEDKNHRGKSRVIDDEHYYDVDGEIICEECLKRRYRRNTDDLIEL